MKRILASLMAAVAILAQTAVFADTAKTLYDFDNIIEVDTLNTNGIIVENGFHNSIWMGKLSTCCTLGLPVTFKFDELSLDGIGSVSFGLMCGYVDEASVLEIKAVFEDSSEYKTSFVLENQNHKIYTVKLPEEKKKLSCFEIFVNSVTEDKSMFDVELEYLKFHKGSSVMLLSTKEAKAVLDGEIIIPDSPAVIKNGSTLTPARFVAEKFGASVDWIASERTVVIKDDKTEIKLVIDSDKAYVNGEEKQLSVPACIIDGRTYTPARFVAENLGCNVGWDAQTKTVFVDR